MLEAMIQKAGRLVPIEALEKLKQAQAWYRRERFYLSGGRTAPPPSSIVIDPANICDLRCPLCPTGLNRLDYPKSLMTPETFRIVVSRIPSLKHINLFNWGEPFLNPQIFQMIRFAGRRRILVSIHSHFSFEKSGAFWDELVESGLDNLTISLDGATQESYAKYRVGGDFGLVLDNVRTLVRLKKRLKSPRPRIVWKMIVHRFNEHEIGKARDTARELGIGFRTAGMGLGDDLPGFEFETPVEERMKQWLPENRKYVSRGYRGGHQSPLYPEPCPQLFTTLTVNPDGKIFPCCWGTSRSQVFGDLLKEPLASVWTNEKYTYSRSLFAGAPGDVPGIETICTRCAIYGKKARLG